MNTINSLFLTDTFDKEKHRTMISFSILFRASYDRSFQSPQ